MVRIRSVLFVPSVCLAISLGAGLTWAHTIVRVSVASDGGQANGPSFRPVLSADGRYVAFRSIATNLVPGDVTGHDDVFVHDTVTGTTELVSVSSSGTQGNGDSYWPAVSADGRYVSFSSLASNLVTGDTNGYRDIFVHDRLTGETKRVSVNSSGAQGSGECHVSAISGDGFCVAFATSSALVPSDTNGMVDIYARDLVSGVTQIVSVSSGGTLANSSSYYVSVSADGRYVAFDSAATNLAPGTTGGVFLRDLTGGTTQRVSVPAGGGEANDMSFWPSISPDGSYVAFVSAATNMVPGDTNAQWDIYGRVPSGGSTERLSVTSDGSQANSGSNWPDASSGGRYVTFHCYATNLVLGDTNGTWDVFVKDRLTGVVQRLSVAENGLQGNADSYFASMTSDGQLVAFESVAGNLVTGDTNGCEDAFVVDRATPIPAAVLVNPGAACTTSRQVSLSVTPNDAVEVRFRNDPGVWTAWEASTTAKSWTLSEGDGTKRVCIQGRDASMSELAEVCDEIVLDATPPTGASIDINGGSACTSSTSVILTLTAIGATEMRLRNGSGTWSAWEPYASTKSWVVPAGSGAKQVCVQYRDSCGNVTAELCDGIELGPPAPSGLAISINGGTTCTDSANVTLTLAATGATEMRFRNEDGAWSAWFAFATQKPWALSATRGVKTVSLQCRNTCGELSATVSDTIARPSFDDLGCSHPQRPYVEVLVREGIAGGCSTLPPLYCPTASVTRAQMAKFLCLENGLPPLDRATPTFADVPNTHWAYGYVERLADPASWGGSPPTGGCRVVGPTKYFCPSKPVTREQMAKFICIAAGEIGYQKTPPTFADVPSTHPFYAWIERLADAGSWPGGVAVTSGCQAGPPALYCPKANITRGQMAVFLVRAFGAAP